MVTSMSNGSSRTPSSTSIWIIPFPNLEEIVPAGWEDLRRMNLNEELRLAVEASKEKTVLENKEEKQGEEKDEVT